ncbi:hypothetical protein JN757_05165 [Pseudomonas granadensis]|uniref:Uncharacterized protein n=1 Tax=Pseudomonas granadensis TaxID=1421430 RepID=A0ABX7GJ87_9PSED|nr:hypothetical protein [Pseudomonas granadensis]QRK85165.1 hypothetical protein JN757_05165 [Pseudomonas granadensis]
MADPIGMSEPQLTDAKQENGQWVLYLAELKEFAEGTLTPHSNIVPGDEITIVASFSGGNIWSNKVLLQVPLNGPQSFKIPKAEFGKAGEELRLLYRVKTLTTTKPSPTRKIMLK